ncbi:MAG: acyl--CoA ligase [Brucellaceae bacterium]|nr:acyl--CoA ligase [Brucellaceae bacterium]
MRIESHLRESCRHHAGKTAIVDGARRVSYAELCHASDGLAAWFAENGVGRGDRVVVFAGNGWQTAVAFYAVWKAGAVACPVNPSTRAKRLAFIIADCSPAAIVADARGAATVADALAINPQARPAVVLTRPHPALPAAADFAQCLETGPFSADPALCDEDLATIIYTSGSTGDPKGVMMGHDNIDAATASIVSYLGNGEADVILSVLPLSFGYGLTQLITAVRVGATLVLEKSFAYPAAVLERLREERVTGFPMVPSMVALLLRMEELDPSLFAGLRYITSAAAPLPVAHIRRLRALLPGVQLYSMYGQTECVRATWLPPVDIDMRPASAGIAIPGTAIQIVDEAGFEVTRGVVGELVVSGPNIMRGYWNNADATAEALRPDPLTGSLRLHTSDLFFAESNGYVTFVSRRDDIIKTGGFKVAPREVESALYDLEGVVEALVVGMPDPVLGETLKAMIVKSADTLTAEDVLRHCAGILNDFMLPRQVEFCQALPKTGSGKLSRRLASGGGTTT